MEEQHPAPLASRTPQASTQEGQTAKGATVKDAIAERVLPRVSPSARQTIRGKIKVIVRVQVDPNGDVSNARLDSPGPSKYFANLALQAAQHWKFKPAQADGHAIASIWILRFRFGRTTTEVSPVEAAPPA
jgi:TonB family protein